MSTITAKPFKLALVQLAGLGKDKTRNLAIASAGVKRAVEEGKANVVVLPEIFNSPYAVTAFRSYAEPIPPTSSLPTPASEILKHAAQAESLAALSSMAQDNGCWLIGGSIPEIESGEDKIYNTCTVYNPQGTSRSLLSSLPAFTHMCQITTTLLPRLGDLIAKHRKVHLFDIDIPGKQTFKESETLTGGTELSTVTTEFGKIGLGICYDIVRRVFLLTLLQPTLPDAFCSSFFFISLIPRVLPSLPIVSPRTDSHTRHKNPYLLFLPRSRPALTYSNTRRRNTIALQRFPEMAMIAARQGCIAMIYPSAFK
ncbi:hypothetical protein QFC24_000053 [Naganishia onofrii]|uniref:Uncharacterized protein n=1 Tax=Naganishia onofrii TaxID=1851511 RepID=A0ACC2XWP6_9TREE|nr:hypothetical protein QFC24_000053 [Naganishia onofrii]